MHRDEISIIYLAKKNDDEAIEFLINRYRNTTFIVMREYTLYLRGVDIEDFIQEGNIWILTNAVYTRKFEDRDIEPEFLMEKVYSSDRDNSERIFFLKNFMKI